mmetsp:Transcript_81884/g.228164  ORF Transcript_81884/g.228164 Transcript_81884/m.228164 type:complete len:203 (-) Transcript_81884:15-623(-)
MPQRLALPCHCRQHEARIPSELLRSMNQSKWVSLQSLEHDISIALKFPRSVAQGQAVRLYSTKRDLAVVSDLYGGVAESHAVYSCCCCNKLAVPTQFFRRVLDCPTVMSEGRQHEVAVASKRFGGVHERGPRSTDNRRNGFRIAATLRHLLFEVSRILRHLPKQDVALRIFKQAPGLARGRRRPWPGAAETAHRVAEKTSDY